MAQDFLLSNDPPVLPFPASPRPPVAASTDLPFPDVAQPDPKMTLRAVVAAYLEMGCERYAARALEERKRVWRRLCDDVVDYPGVGPSRLGDRPVGRCRPIDLMKWLASHPEWKSDWTRRGVINAVQRPLNWAAKGRLIPDNPFSGVSNPEGDPRRPMTDAELARILRAASAVFRRVLIFMAHSGARTNEMARLIWAWVDFERGAIIIPKEAHKTGKKTKKPRVIPLTRCAQKLLVWLWWQEAWPRIHTDETRIKSVSLPCPSVAQIALAGLTGHVFKTVRGTPWNRCNLSLRMRRLRQKAGIPDDCYLYGARHRYGTNWIKAGGSLKQLSKAMGHTSVAITERMYVHLDGEIDVLREGAEAATRRKSGRPT